MAHTPKNEPTLAEYIAERRDKLAQYEAAIARCHDLPEPRELLENEYALLQPYSQWLLSNDPALEQELVAVLNEWYDVFREPWLYPAPVAYLRLGDGFIGYNENGVICQFDITKGKPMTRETIDYFRAEIARRKAERDGA